MASDGQAPSPRQGPPITGQRRIRLLHDLALGDLSVRELAAKYGKAEQTIMNITYENKDEIDKIRTALREDQYSALNHLWIAQQELRIAEAQADYEDLVEDIEELQTHAQAQGKPVAQSRAYLHCRDSKRKIRRDVADELGQLPTRTTVQLGTEPEGFAITINGVDMSQAYPGRGDGVPTTAPVQSLPVAESAPEPVESVSIPVSDSQPHSAVPGPDPEPEFEGPAGVEPEDTYPSAPVRGLVSG
jgi:hypothetical protein